MKTTHPVIIGIDTHKASHVAVAIDTQGTRLAALSIPTNPKGYLELERWSRSLGEVLAFGIEGTGSYGAGLSRSLLAQGHNVVEVTRPNRQLRYTQGKTDSLDAEGAARSVLSGQATARPKTQTGSSEMIRHLKIARDTAVKSRSQAMVTLKTLIINAPADLRDTLDQIRGKVALIRHIAAFRPGDIDSPSASAKVAMRALARRWLWLNEEIFEHDKELERLVTERAPGLMASHGIATLTVAEMLILVGDDPTRIRSEAAFAKLCGVCPIPASSGKTHRFRLNRGGNRQANAALYRVAIVRMRSHEPTLAYVKKRTKDGKSKSEIIRCLKRYIVREIYSQLCVPTEDYLTNIGASYNKEQNVLLEAKMKEVRDGIAWTRRQMVLGVFLWIAILGAAMFYLLRWVDRDVHVTETLPQGQPSSNAAAELGGTPFEEVPDGIATDFLADCWAMIRAQPGFEAGRGSETDSLEDIQGQGRILLLVDISGNRIQLDRLQDYVPVGLDRAQAQRVYATATRAIRTCGIAENALPNGSYVFTFDPAATEIVVSPATPSHRVASAVNPCWTAGTGLAGSVTVAVRTDQDRVVVDQVGNQQNPMLFQAARRAVLRCLENTDHTG